MSREGLNLCNKFENPLHLHLVALHEKAAIFTDNSPIDIVEKLSSMLIVSYPNILLSLYPKNSFCGNFSHPM